MTRSAGKLRGWLVHGFCTYTPQKKDGPLSAKKTEKAHFNEFTIKKVSDKASTK